MPAVSVIIPVFERVELAQRAVRSALTQTYQDIEVIVVDDGSTTPLALEGQDLRLRLIRHDKNRGAAAARNTGIEAATGGWIAFLDSDDVWHPEKLDRQMAVAENTDSSLSAFCCGFRLHGNSLNQGRALIPVEAKSLHDFVAGCWFCPGSTLLLRKNVFDAVGLFDTELPRLEDYEWFLRFAEANGTLKVAPHVLADIHVGERPRPEAVERAAKKIAATLINQKYAHRRRAEAYLMLECAVANLRDRRFFRGAMLLLKSLFLAPRQRLQLRKFWTSAE